jgi:hypothetical protein
VGGRQCCKAAADGGEDRGGLAVSKGGGASVQQSLFLNNLALEPDFGKSDERNRMLGINTPDVSFVVSQY